MKKFAVMLLAASFLTSVAFGAADADRTIATYKGGEVKESQVMTFYKSILDAQPDTKNKKFVELDPKLQEMLTRGYISSFLLKDEAKKNGIESSKEFQDKINLIKDQLISQMTVERQVKSAVTDAAISAEYDKLVASLKGQQELKVSHILVDTEKKAKEIKNKLNQKTGKETPAERFAALAKENSLDEDSKVKGGEIGYVLKGQFVPNFENKAFSMKDGEISDPVQTEFGWHIIMVSGRRPARIPTLDEVKASISGNLQRAAADKYFNDLNSKADIKLNLPKPDATLAPAATVPVDPATTPTTPADKSATSAPAADNKKPATK